MLGAAAVDGDRAAVGENAARDGRADRRQEAGDGVQAAVVLAPTAPRDAAQKADRVRVAGLVEHLLGRPLLHQLAGVQHAHPVAHLGDHAQVVADEEQRRGQLLAQRRDQVEHLGLDGRVQPGGRLVQDQQGRLDGQRHGDHDPLLHAARELVRIALHDRVGVGDAHPPKRVHGAFDGRLARQPAHLEHLRHLAADADRRVERAGRVLVDHGHGVRAQPAQVARAQPQHVVAVQGDRAAGHAAVSGQVADDGQGGGGLAAAGFADQPVGLAAGDRKRHRAQHLAVVAAHPVGDVQLIDGQRVGRGGSGLAHRSTTRSMASAIRLTPITRVAMAAASNSTSHQ